MYVLWTMDERLILFCSVEDQTQVPVHANKHSATYAGLTDLLYYIQTDIARGIYSSIQSFDIVI